MQGRVLRSFLDDSGQDVIEYGLLAMIIGVVGVLIFPSIKTAMGVAFGSWGDGVYGLWAPKDPGT